MSQTTHMRAEIDEIPEAIKRFLDGSKTEVAAAGTALKDVDPGVIATIARGSSDHAASFLKYAIELVAGVPVASLAPSIASIYQAKLKLGNTATISVSQSGESPDIIAITEMAQASGALTLTLTNKSQSPLAKAVDQAIDIAAGPELSVAATKSYVNSIVAGLAVLAEWQDDEGLKTALQALPEHAKAALACNWDDLTAALDGDNSLFVLGRGPAMAIASEIALKFKEACGLHAEAYSAAEVMHGPVALVDQGFPVLTLAARDRAEEICLSAAEKLAGDGADVFVTADGSTKSKKLPFAATGHPITDALCLVLPFYSFVEGYARHLGLNPDKPPRLRKVTETK